MQLLSVRQLHSLYGTETISIWSLFMYQLAYVADFGKILSIYQYHASSSAFNLGFSSIHLLPTPFGSSHYKHSTGGTVNMAQCTHHHLTQSAQGLARSQLARSPPHWVSRKMCVCSENRYHFMLPLLLMYGIPYILRRLDKLFSCFSQANLNPPVLHRSAGKMRLSPNLALY